MPVALGVASVAVSWQRWINPFLDSSREMNVPARLAAGERLYRDVVYHYGPAGPWLEAAAIAVFGRRFVVLEGAALLATIVLFGSLWLLTARAGSRLSACLATSWAAALCLGAPNGGSFLFPYSFDALFALAGGFLCLALAAEARAGAPAFVSALGLCLALASKPEVGAAAAVVLLLGVARSEDRRCARRVLWIAAAGTGAALALWAIAFLGVPWSDLSPEGPFALFSPPAEWRRVYRVIAGLTDPGASLSAIATALFLAGSLLGAAWLVAKAAGRAPRLAEAAWTLAAAGVASFFLLAGSGIEDRLPPLLSPMPIVAGLAALWSMRVPLDSPGQARWLLLGFSAACGSRVLLGLAYGARTTPYSILAVPGLAASTAVLVLDLLPRRIQAAPAFRRLVAIAFLGLAVCAVFRWRRLQPADRSVPLQTTAGTLRLPTERARVTAEVLAYLSANAKPGDTLSGAPETGFFNFVTGLENPLRQEQIFPGHLDAAREARVARRIESGGPRYFLLVDEALPAFEATVFGRDYAVEVWKAVEKHYRLAAALGETANAAPAGRPPFAVLVFERRP